jgi:hypothetical protein
MRDRLRLFVAAAGAVIIAGVLTRVVYALPAAPRTYVALAIVAGALVAGGFVLLINVIPNQTPKADIKTEFYSARAAFIAVLAGLGLFAIVAIGAVVARVLLTLRRP